ncbi:MAG TPA: hypothetical protein DCS07_18120 [Bdellovibrionales bacterium]|nr:MAG: hypothetical protein A2Z97_04350 [Bdellovibrionales bacterium GWB1_52_6]OFZ05066.1 MAG: hypothetical protein A2X97_00540 [Bdellovibrionales bacterium GWA1_52_35]OFZ34159.1 MAG: hypothetical protein A2070_05770 [Bdellovibrionales bacterium GWC1_52_8]HAR44519.1 hypothetical protein [Bdellovibrionales bacterium]HCM41302.1 hypothetical protein [Bdellovibrionales bacterium]
MCSRACWIFDFIVVPSDFAEIIEITETSSSKVMYSVKPWPFLFIFMFRFLFRSEAQWNFRACEIQKTTSWNDILEKAGSGLRFSDPIQVPGFLGN